MRSSTIILSASVISLALLAGVGVMLYLRVKRRTPDGKVTIEDIGTEAGEVLEEIVITAKRIPEAVSDAVSTVPRGIRNNNPGNIEWIEDPAKRWRGMVGRDGRYGIFESMALGVRAIGGELKASERKGQNTIAEVITEWAPPPENNTAAYIAHVCKIVGVGPHDRINIIANAPALAEGIIRHENGGLFGITREQIANWVYLP